MKSNRFFKTPPILPQSASTLRETFSTSIEARKIFLESNVRKFSISQLPKICFYPQDLRKRQLDASRQLKRAVPKHEIMTALAAEYGHDEWNANCITRTGKELAVHISTLSKRNEQGQIDGYLSFLQDVSELAVNAVPRFTNRMFRAFTDSALNAIVVMDSHGRVAHWNKMASKIFGYTPEEALGHNVHNLLAPPEFHKQAKEGFKTFLKTGKGPLLNQTLPAMGVRKDGTQFPLEISVSGFQVNNEWWASGFLYDLTEREKTKEAIKIQAAELKVANKKLELLREQAESATQAKSLFLANMSHEIRTPLNGLIGMSELLMDADLNLEQAEYAETIRKSGESLLMIINDILDFSKIEAGQIELEILDFDLNKMLDDIVDILALKAQEKDLELVSLIEADVPPLIQGDSIRLRQILINLINNALKFTEKGEVSVHVQREPIEETDYKKTNLSPKNQPIKLRFEVSDTGIGIPQDKLDRLFKAFSQADVSTTRKYGGTGLGLSIASALVEMMGGEIHVESQVNLGSTFCFTAFFQPSEKSALLPGGSQNLFQNRKILAVDDNATNRRLLEILLKTWKTDFKIVSNATEAIQEMIKAKRENCPFEVALLDRVMPEMDGLSLAHSIKKDPEIANTPLILLSSFTDRNHLSDEDSTLFYGHLTKPIKRSQLFETIFTVFKKRENSLQEDGSKVQTDKSAAPSVELPARTLRILLAEDNPTNQMVVQRLLSKMGHQIDAVENGQLALEALSQNDYDLVLMDVQMPIMDGLEATRTIRDPRSAVRDHRIPIIALSAHAMREDRNRCLAAGADEYLTKPIQPHVLRKCISEIAHSRQESSKPLLPIKKTASPEAVKNESETMPQKTAPATPDHDVISIEKLIDETCEGDHELAEDLLQSFLETYQLSLTQIDQALSMANAEELNRAAHKFKGTLLTIQAEEAGHLAFELEQAGKEEKLANTIDLALQLRLEVDALIETIRQYLSPEEVQSKSP